MKQLSLFDPPQNNVKKQKNMIRLFVDGASRNNPGPSGAGLYIIKNNEVVDKRGYYLGKKTNNQAEYLALLLGLSLVRNYCQPDDQLEIVSDSQLLVRQLQGAYKVRNQELIPLYGAAKKILSAYDHVASHVMRNDNTHADALANKGIDEKILIPAEHLSFLAYYGIHLD